MTAQPVSKKSFSLFAVSRWSLRLRLSLFFAVFLALAWAFAALLAWKESREYIDEFFDSQQMLFAKRLASADFGSLTDRLPGAKAALRGSPEAEKGKLEDDALGFAVFTHEGELVLSDGENGDDFLFDASCNGFTETTTYGSNDVWRIVWLTSPDSRFKVAVGQELDYREDMAFDMLVKQLAPWVLLLPVLLGGMFWMLSRELAPLRGLAKELERRRPDDTAALTVAGVPSEVLPLAQALNALFARIAQMLVRERAFISDAAHELRTPLTALRIQAEVAGMPGADEGARKHALNKLLAGIDRSTQLVEQLLTLSRLEAMHEAQRSEERSSGALCLGEVDWSCLVDEALLEHRPRMEQKSLSVTCTLVENPTPVRGYPMLVALVLRNLFDNAVKYTPAGGEIHIRLERQAFVMENTGPGVPDSFLPRLGERFARPPGQAETGSGLGLSIAKRAAELSGLVLHCDNTIHGGHSGFTVSIRIS